MANKRNSKIIEFTTSYRHKMAKSAEKTKTSETAHTPMMQQYLSHL